MIDTAFEPSLVTIEKGEKVTFRFTNEGEQADHQKDRSSGEMHHGGGDEGAIDVKPGKTRTLTSTFTSRARCRSAATNPATTPLA